MDRLKLCQCARFVRNFQRELGGNISNGTFCECYIAKIYLPPTKMATSIEIPLRDTEDEVEFT